MTFRLSHSASTPSVQSEGCMPLQVSPFSGVRPSPVFPRRVSNRCQYPATSADSSPIILTVSHQNAPSHNTGRPVDDVSPDKNVNYARTTAAFTFPLNQTGFVMWSDSPSGRAFICGFCSSVFVLRTPPRQVGFSKTEP